MTAITGNTYPVKESLKAMGGKWDARQKAWMVPDEVAEDARALVSTSSRKYRRGVGYSSSGAFMVSRQGRCEDAPCCGCCD